ncbi:polyribonucleotide nucleotidyltransferase [Rickettsiales bacterium]|nr:polyribonucleotide nucleotidyltransferase [Rickettsiales bacterium]
MSLKKDYKITFGGREMTFSVDYIAKQASGSVVVKYADTVVLCTAVVGKESDEEKDFLPLTVNYIEKFYAIGQIPGGFLKREGRPSEAEILTSRVIDRSLRPLFADGFTRDVQVVCTLMSYSKDGDCEVAAMIGASLACSLAGLPLKDVMAGCRVGLIDGELVLNPVKGQENNQLDLFVSSTRDSIFMVESEANELSESGIIDALRFAKESVEPVIDLIEKVTEEHGKEKVVFEVPNYDSLYASIKDKYTAAFKDAYLIKHKQERSAKIGEINKSLKGEFVSEENSKVVVGSLSEKLQKEIVRKYMYDNNVRIDGRGFEDIRDITCDIDVLPKNIVHGSSVFTRGETQAFVVTTLGSGVDEQYSGSVSGINEKESFLLHYNFPSYAVGEVGAMRSPGRREIGHGNLANMALRCVLPSKEEFPYTIRVVSEITESNGSSSMATVCGSTLSLLSTGVPLKNPVSGIAMGLIKEGDNAIVLTDIMGDEDHLGDMDFKVAKTENGITALQMDIKIGGISIEIMSAALKQASDACHHILDKINGAISGPAQLGQGTPKMETMQIPVKKIGDLIGKGGANIKEICEVTGGKLDVDPNGLVTIFAKNNETMEEIKIMIENLILDLTPGDVYIGIVEKIMPFGLIVSLPGNKSGMVHISEISEERVENIEDYVKEGDTVNVLLMGFDERRRAKLSIRRAAQ